MTPAQITAKLAATRAKIADLQADRAAVERAPQSRAETVDYWRHQFEQAAAGRARVVGYHLAARADGAPLTVATPRTGEALDLTPVLASLFGPDRLLELLAPHFDRLPEGLSETARREKLAELDRQINELEHAEMSAIEAAEAAGVPFTWRGDMSPAVVLRVVQAA